MRNKLGILLIFVLILSSHEVLGASGVNENKLDISKSMEKTYYTVVYVDVSSGEELDRIDDVDGFVGEELEIDEDYVNIFRGYKYIGMNRKLNERKNSDAIKVVLGQDTKDNKIYVLYEKDSRKLQQRVSISKKISLI